MQREANCLYTFTPAQQRSAVSDCTLLHDLLITDIGLLRTKARLIEEKARLTAELARLTEELTRHKELIRSSGNRKWALRFPQNIWRLSSQIKQKQARPSGVLNHRSTGTQILILMLLLFTLIKQQVALLGQKRISDLLNE